MKKKPTLSDRINTWYMMKYLKVEYVREFIEDIKKDLDVPALHQYKSFIEYRINMRAGGKFM